MGERHTEVYCIGRRGGSAVVYVEECVDREDAIPIVGHGWSWFREEEGKGEGGGPYGEGMEGERRPTPILDYLALESR